MTLIDKTYFHTNINIPNLDSSYISENLNNFIIEYEPEILLYLLGLNLYNTYIANPTDSRFIVLTNGITYTTTTGEQKKWRGLKTVIGSNKYSLIAYYVYYFYTRNEVTNTTGVGEAINKTSNATRVSPIQKQTLVWNKMLDWIYELYDFLDANKQTYPEWNNMIYWFQLHGNTDNANPFNL